MTKEYISHKITPVIGSMTELEEYRANTDEYTEHHIALHFDVATVNEYKVSKVQRP